MAAEISFLVCLCVFFTEEKDHKCLLIEKSTNINDSSTSSYTTTDLGSEYSKAFILLVILHSYLILKAIYFAYGFKNQVEEGCTKCCFQCWCCYTLGVSIYIQVVYFKYGAQCERTLPKSTLWLMIEVIIFYAYLILECAVALLIFGSMYRDHKIVQREEAERAAEAAADMEKATTKKSIKDDQFEKEALESPRRERIQK